MPGPAPDPNALRRDRKDDASWLTLPSLPRTDPAPEWPLLTQSARESDLWVEYWRKPQARLWLQNGQQHEVAIFVRRVAEAEQPEASVTLNALVQRLMDALLLTIPAMHKARVKIAADEVAARREAKAPVPKLSASERLKARSAEVG
jgi:hypothetical protein